MEVTTDDTTDFTEKYFENPTYDGTSMIRIHSKPSQGVNRVPVLPVAVRQHAHQQASSQAAFSGAGTTYDAVNTASPKAAGNGQTYDVLDRGKINSKYYCQNNIYIQIYTEEIMINIIGFL